MPTCSDDNDKFDELKVFHDNLNHLIDHIDAGRDIYVVRTVCRIVVDISVNRPADMPSGSKTRKGSFPLVYPRSRRNWTLNHRVAKGRIDMTPFEKAQQAKLESVVIQLYRLRYDAAGKLELVSTYASALREACLEYLISIGKRMASSLPNWNVGSGELTYQGERVLKLTEKGANWTAPL